MFVIYVEEYFLNFIGIEIFGYDISFEWYSDDRLCCCVEWSFKFVFSYRGYVSMC